MNFNKHITERSGGIGKFKQVAMRQQNINFSGAPPLPGSPQGTQSYIALEPQTMDAKKQISPAQLWS